ncbi:hypothetical protein BE18_07590 [Sorangium cellulosum]|uniref:Uncharacterized protein n=1 Tax=Sorangium cellulosum TaxID=56 RepID=A0A150S6P5_SORCE|nr:hypothetical protein BE18_07590 [Sorangium cellulosum]
MRFPLLKASSSAFESVFSGAPEVPALPSCPVRETHRPHDEAIFPLALLGVQSSSDGPSSMGIWMESPPPRLQPLAVAAAAEMNPSNTSASALN